MRRRDKPTPHHPLPRSHPVRRVRRQRTRQKVHSMMLAGAALFAPHAGVPPARPFAPIKLIEVEMTSVGVVATTSHFRLAEEQRFEGLIDEASRKYGLSKTLIRAVIRTESAYNAKAVSPAGAQGLMQLMPALQKDMGVKNPFDARQNIMAGTRYLAGLLANHDGNLELALASYNAGPGNVARYHGIPPFTETINYIERITNLVGPDDVYAGN